MAHFYTFFALPMAMKLVEEHLGAHINCANEHASHENIRWSYDCKTGIVKVTDGTRTACAFIGPHAGNIGSGVGFAMESLEQSTTAAETLEEVAA